MEGEAHVAYWSADAMGILAREYGLSLALFELLRPGSVLPDEKFGRLWRDCPRVS